MRVRVEHLPDLRIINFYLDESVCDSALLLTPDNQYLPQFVKNIFSYAGEGRFLLSEELVSFKYKEAADVENLRLLIMAELEDFLADRPDISDIKGEKDVMNLAEAVADSYIRPTLVRDKGNIEITGFSNGILSLKFSGHCADCPFSQNTLNNVVSKAFKRFIPEIKEIRLEK